MSFSNKTLKSVYTFVLLAAAIFLLTFFVRWLFKPSGVTLRIDEDIDMPSSLLEYERNTIGVFQTASPAVVFVHNLAKQRNLWNWSVNEVQQGTGSGFLWDKRGHIITNFHVVQGADRIAVTLIDSNTYEAEVVGIEPSKDLAVLKIDLVDTNVQPFIGKVADSSKVLVGQKAIAIGNPYGLDHTLTVGAISAIGRSMSSVVEGVTIRDMIQTDAAINPGNSGGPLLDSAGRLLGMNTLILRNSTGIGFAVPSNTIARLVSQIIEHGKPVQVGIGIQIFNERTSLGIARRFGIKGMMIREVYPGSPAEAAGLRGPMRNANGDWVLGDIIVRVDGEPVNSYDDMYHAFDTKQAGETIDIVVFREGQEQTFTIELVTISD